MPKLLYELDCDACGAMYELQFIEDEVNEEDPIYCPFCGADIDLTEIDSDEIDEGSFNDFDEVEFDEEER
jgi:NAD-dependent SIR2 family protein deacetylase